MFFNVWSLPRLCSERSRRRARKSDAVGVLLGQIPYPYAPFGANTAIPKALSLRDFSLFINALWVFTESNQLSAHCHLKARICVLKGK